MEEFIQKLSVLDLRYYMLSTTCEFDIEYIPKYARSLENISGFTGSNGTLIIDVKQKKLYLFTDARYLLQAKNEMDKLINFKYEVILLEYGKKILLHNIIEPSKEKIFFNARQIPMSLIEKFHEYEKFFSFELIDIE